jgi:nucleoside-diphosphate-sugar epimerase
MKVFLVGAGGFIGRRVAALLESCGHEVAAHLWEERGDLTAQAIPEDADVLVNAAGMLGGPKAGIGDLRRANIEPARILALAASGTGTPLVHLSTPGVTGLVASASEDLPPAPWGAYEQTKAEAEAILREGVPARILTILRPDFVYGPGDRHKLAFFRQVAKGWFPLVGNGGARIRPTFADDAAAAVAASLPGSPLSGGLYNIGGPEVVSIRRFAGLCAESMGRRVRLLAIPPLVYRAAMLLGPLRPPALSASRLALFGRDHFVDTSKASAAGFSPPTPLCEGLRITVASYRAEGLL